MTERILYRHMRSDGGMSVSLDQPSGEYTTLLRLVADSGKALTSDGIAFHSCIDVESADGWVEVDYPEFEEIEE